MFALDPGATISNVVIGADQSEGIHCLGPCTIDNAWSENVRKDAVTFLQRFGTSTITVDKVLQHSGSGVVKIDSFCVEDFGKLY
ncbi:hypothetical protein RSAG8_02735, partial [Rhizoctonia solani AG-8 WAC10335]